MPTHRCDGVDCYPYTAKEACGAKMMGPREPGVEMGKPKGTASAASTSFATKASKTEAYDERSEGKQS